MYPENKNAKSVVLVDDDEDDRQFLREPLLRIVKGIKITELTNGIDLLEFIKRQTPRNYPSLIVLDLDMPKMNGLEVLIFLKSVTAYRHIPVVMISANKNQDFIGQVYQHGLSAFIAKPSSFEEYVRIAELLDNSFLNQQCSYQNFALECQIRNKSVLIIEDNPDHWMIMSKILRQTVSGINIFRTFDRLSTLNFLLFNWKTLPEPPCLIILDLYLPSRDAGLHVLDTIRHFLFTHDKMPVPVVVFSYSDRADDIAMSYRHFANVYITKPTDFTELSSCIANIYNFWFRVVTLPKNI